MSKIYNDVDLSMAFNEGHNDAWNGNKPREAPNGLLSDQKHQAYRRGHVAGTTARYYYDKGFADGRA